MSKFIDFPDEKKLRERIEKVMKDFHPTKENIQRIIALNDGLYRRFKMCFDDLLYMRKIVEEDMNSGRLKISNYQIFPEYFFAYDYENGIKTADSDTLMELSDKTSYLMPTLCLTKDSRTPDFDTDFLCEEDPKLSFNIEDLNLPGLENTFIHMFMHHIFQDATTFCVADIPYLKPEDLQWQIVVEYEHFFKDDY